MDAMDYPNTDSKLAKRDSRSRYDSHRPGSLDQNHEEGDGWRMVDVTLTGGAPWGFTLRGGLEHREPLLITKVEEGSKAGGVRLQVGDELVVINDILLTGYRQEAICLVKGSHKTLTLSVRRRMRMVDIVAQKMPSESDVHVARSFLTKILRSSMRRNEPVIRPHSWHSTKFNEIQSEAAKTHSTPSPVWQTRYDASSSSTDLSAGWEQTNLRRVSDQFSSLGSMDSLEHSSHPYPPGRLSPAKSNNNSVEHLGGGKRDSAYSSFSTGSGTPDYTLSKSNAASTENMVYKTGQWESGCGRQSNGRHTHGEGARQDERPGYFHLPTGVGGRESPRTEELPGSRHSSSSRTNCGPVWNIPDKRKTAAPSPPPPAPPAPPARSDSFAATKVHEKGLVAGPLEGSGVHSQLKSKSLERTIEGPDNPQRAYQAAEFGSEARRNYNAPPKNDSVNPYNISDGPNHQHLSSNKTYSLSSTDVRVGHPPYTNLPYHQRQCSDESSSHAQSVTPSAPKSQSTSSFYSSMQELPTNNINQFYNQNPGRMPTASLSSTAIDQNPDSRAQSRYYCVTTRQPPQTMSSSSQVKVENWRDGVVTEVVQGGSDRSSVSSQGGNKSKHSPPYPQQHYPNSRGSNGYLNQHHEYPGSSEAHSVLDPSAGKSSFDPRIGQKHSTTPNSDTHHMSYPQSKQSEHRRSEVHLQSKDSALNPVMAVGDAMICPQKTPMLHSLTQGNSDLGDKPTEMSGRDSQQEAFDPSSNKQGRRKDRFATTLRNEIQMRRAQLQKSHSAATLSGSMEAEEEPGVWRSAENSTSSSDGSFTSTYKDHLKEAQARVLKATSFRRRDLEPILLEHPGAEAMPSYPSSALGRKDVAPLPSVSEVPPSKPATAGGQVSRIGGRKRFPADKKVRSFSEPDKIHEMGVDEEPLPPDSAASLVDRRKFFEATGKPAFPKPIPKQSQQAHDDHRFTKPGGISQSSLKQEVWREGKSSTASTDQKLVEGQHHSVPGQQQALLEQQRLGTFAEYEATWNIQRKPAETRTSGRYRSADNILDQGMEERSKPPCVHERSRSSPSADFYGQNILVHGRKSAEYTQTGTELNEQKSSNSSDVSCVFSVTSEPSHWFFVPDRLCERGQPELCPEEKVSDPEQFPDPPPPLLIAEDPSPDESSLEALPAHRAPPPDPVAPPPYFPDPFPSLEPPPLPQNKTSVPQRPSLSRSEHNAPQPPLPLSKSQESLPSSQGGAPSSRSLGNGPSPTSVPAPHPTPAPWKDSERSKAARKEEELQSEPVAPPVVPAPPALPAQQLAVLTPPAMQGQRSPSPQFAPQRLTDKPPASVPRQDESSGRMEKVTDHSTSVKKVPIKIVHTESDSDKESRQFLHLPGGGAPEAPQDQDLPPPPPSLGAPEQSYSVFSAYTRQRDPAVPSGAAAMGPQREPRGPPNNTHDVAHSRPPEQDCQPESPSAATGKPVNGNGVLAEPVEAADSDGVTADPARPTSSNGVSEDPVTSNGVAAPSPLARTEEDKKTEELARDIMDKDKSLVDILDQRKMKTTMDLMEGIFPQGGVLLEGAQQRRKATPKLNPPPSVDDRKEEDSMAAAVALVTSSAYYSTSAPKAELLIKMKDMQEQQEEHDSEQELEEEDSDLASKKHELIDSLSRKLCVLREARESLQEDVQENAALGREVEAVVQAVCKPNELDKFRMFVGDLDKVVSLLLSLSGRLARVENALNSLEEDAPPEERRTLTEKRKLLIRQHEDAKELKEHLDRRERLVSDILASHLPPDGLADYQHFVKMKSALIIEQRKLEDKIRLGEEQLKGLMDSLPI